MLDRLLFLRHLEPDEELQLVVHKHGIILVSTLFWPSLAFLLAIFTLTQLPYRTVIPFTAIWAIAACVWWLRNFFDTFLDAWIITDRAIIDVEWFGWFHRKSTRILYSDIEGVSEEIQGVLATLFRYGTVSIERIATGQIVSLDYVPHPRRVEGIILQSMEEYLHSKNLKDATHVQEILSQIVAEQLQLRDIEDMEEEEVSP